MDLKNRHPLNAIDGYENLSMLEALIPFVEYPLKLPLALFIKFGEIRLIIKCFQSPNNLTRLGLHYATSDPWDMICALTGMSPELVKMMFSMMNNGGDSMFSDLFANFPGDEQTDRKHSDNTNPDNKSNSGFSPENIANMMNMVQAMQSGFSQATPEHKMPNSAPQSNDDFEQKIQNMLAEYDLEQASEYSAYNQTNDGP